jgi:nitrogen fixation protein NifB
MAKVAVASTDGITVNEHFGRSVVFFIYEVDEQGGYQLLERREVVSDANSSHAATAARVVADVEVVLAVQFGPHAEQVLREAGVLSLSLASSIEKALAAYGKRGKLIRNSIKRINLAGGHDSCTGCSGGCR